MTYDAVETSAYDGYAVEIYDFVGTISNFKLTSYATDYIFNFQTYTAVPGLKRKGIKKTSSGGSQVGELEIEIPFDHPLALDYAFSDVPPNLTLELKRGHASDADEAFITMWKGAVTSWTVEKRLAKLRVPSAFSLVVGNTMPSKRWQGPCNHLLYSSECGASRLLHDQATTVVTLAGLTIQLNVLTLAANAGDGGEIINNRTGERRTIQSHSGTTITIKVPFTDLITGDPVTIYKGCDHTAATCDATFNNLDNFGGFNLIPALNPFTQGRLR